MNIYNKWISKRRHTKRHPLFLATSLILFVYIFVFANSCEKKIEWPLQISVPDVIVVDGMITDEYKKHSVKISRPLAGMNAKPVPVSGAVVKISDGSNVYFLTEDSVDLGNYKTASMKFSPGKYYRLEISLNGKIYLAESYMQPDNNFHILRYAKNKADNLYHIDWVANVYHTQRQSMWEIILDWSNVSGYQNLPPDQCKARLVFYTLSTLDVSEIFAPTVESVSFPLGTQITERRYSLTDEHAEFVRAMLLESEWHGGYFDSYPATVPSNLSEGAVGFFSACAVKDVIIPVQ